MWVHGSTVMSLAVVLALPGSESISHGSCIIHSSPSVDTEDTVVSESTEFSQCTSTSIKTYRSPFARTSSKIV